MSKLIEDEQRISCDEDEIFVLTQLGWNAMSEHIQKKYKVGEPVKGYESSVFEHWYVQGYFEKVGKWEQNNQQKRALKQ